MSQFRFAGYFFIALLLVCAASSLRAESLTLRFLGPDREPVANAPVRVWVMPKPKDWDGSWRTFNSDENGIVTMTYEPDGEVTLLGFNIKTDGYTPFYSEWNDPKNDPFPGQYTVKLDKAETIGGIVTDDTGQPLAEATVSTSFQWGKRSRIVADRFGCSVETTTDDEGRWRVGYVPKESLGETSSISLKHPDFRQTNFPSVPLSRFAANADGQFTEILSMERGITVSGKVVDEAGKPIAGATVYCSNAADSFRPFTATTDESGGFSFNNCAETNGQYLIARADGFALEMKDGLWFKPDMEPVGITLKPGKTFRAKVVDADGKPVPKARLWIEGWRTQRYPNSEIFGGLPTTDDEGTLIWENVPAGTLVVSIHPSDAKDRALRGQSITASDTEQTFTMQPAVKVAMKVVDAKTGQPIPNFVIRKGYRFQGRAQISWDANQPPTGRDGAFDRYFDETYDFVIKIEAEGYAPSISREISLTENNVTLEFALEEPGETVQEQGLSGVVHDPDGNPVADATVALARQNQSPYIQNGTLLDGSNCVSAKTNDEGGFTLSLPEEEDMTFDYKLFVLHPSGFAQMAKADFEARNTITLIPWARVDGRVDTGSKPARNLSLALRPEEEREIHQLRAWFDYRATSDGNGKFVFENVPPGKANVYLEISWGIRAGGRMGSYSHAESVELVSGETASVKLGGVGRPIVGKLTVPDALEGILEEPPNWNFCLVKCEPAVEEDPGLEEEFRAMREKAEELQKMMPENIVNEPDMEERQRLYQEWMETEDGKKFQELFNEQVMPLQDAFNEKIKERNERQSESWQRSRSCAVDSDGSFRLEDVPAGDWTLKVDLYIPMSPDQCGPSDQAATLSYPVTIAEIPGGQSDEPLNLGTLTLEKAATRQRLIGIGAEAPDFELARLVAEGGEAETIKLSDYRGKTVVLEFWATWCGPCLAKLPEIVQFYEKTKDNPNVVLLGISIDNDEKMLRNFLARKDEMAWPQLRTDPDSPLTRQYGVYAIPAMIVVDPDGKVVAVNPIIGEIEKMAEK